MSEEKEYSVKVWGLVYYLSDEDNNAKKDWFIKAGKKLPFKKLIQPIEVARVLSFMSSEESGLMSGSIIDFAEIIIGPIEGKEADKL